MVASNMLQQIYSPRGYWRGLAAVNKLTASRWPDIVVVEMDNKMALLIDVAVPADTRREAAGESGQIAKSRTKIFPCTIKIWSSLLAPVHLGGPRKRLWWWYGVFSASRV